MGHTCIRQENENLDNQIMREEKIQTLNPKHAKNARGDIEVPTEIRENA